jgi:hypothetical protein
MTNKLFLTCLLVFFTTDWQLKAGLICCGLYTIILLRQRPHIRIIDDILARVTQVCIFLLLLGGLVVQVEGTTTNDAYDVAMSVVLIAITVGAVFFFLYQAVQFIREKYRRHQLNRNKRDADTEHDQSESLLRSRPQAGSNASDGSPHGSMDQLRDDTGQPIVPLANIELSNRASPRYVASPNHAAALPASSAISAPPADIAPPSYPSGITSTPQSRQHTPSTNTNPNQRVSFDPTPHIHTETVAPISSSSSITVDVSPRGGAASHGGMLFVPHVSSTGTPHSGASMVDDIDDDENAPPVPPVRMFCSLSIDCFSKSQVYMYVM